MLSKKHIFLSFYLAVDGGPSNNFSSVYFLLFLLNLFLTDICWWSWNSRVVTKIPQSRDPSSPSSPSPPSPGSPSSPRSGSPPFPSPPPPDSPLSSIRFPNRWNSPVFVESEPEWEEAIAKWRWELDSTLEALLVSHWHSEDRASAVIHGVI